jgi:hypothetical protein
MHLTRLTAKHRGKSPPGREGGPGCEETGISRRWVALDGVIYIDLCTEGGWFRQNSVAALGVC